MRRLQPFPSAALPDRLLRERLPRERGRTDDLRAQRPGLQDSGPGFLEAPGDRKPDLESAFDRGRADGEGRGRTDVPCRREWEDARRRTRKGRLAGVQKQTLQDAPDTIFSDAEETTLDGVKALRQAYTQTSNGLKIKGFNVVTIRHGPRVPDRLLHRPGRLPHEGGRGAEGRRLVEVDGLMTGLVGARSGRLSNYHDRLHLELHHRPPVDPHRRHRPLVILGTVAYLILLERKVASWVQDRIGPNRVGPYGLLQPIADGLKFILKEDYRPAGVDKVLFTLAPGMMIIVIIISIAVLPWGGITR